MDPERNGRVSSKFMEGVKRAHRQTLAGSDLAVA